MTITMTAIMNLNDEVLKTSVSQSRVVTRLRSGGTFIDLLIANLPLMKSCNNCFVVSRSALSSLACAIGPF